ncbi:MAG: AzlD domain-containing protein [Eggerthellaceae bacterium]|nr:AzlD domain-containing protein [Hugonella massiliensis]MDD6729808.1 AzlD domain-containing protein [Eggerthellaceae bacterium]
MTLQEFFLIYGICLVCMLVCRCVPIFVLKGRELPAGVQRALNLIPVAAFSALVANDLFAPGMFDAGFWPAAMPLVAAAVVVVVAWKTRSLVWCAVTGVVVYAILLFL